MSAYKDLDDAICEHIGTGSPRHPIYVGRLLDMALAELGGGRDDGRRAWRLIDRRMQVLRKAGRLKFVRAGRDEHGWSLA